MYVQFITLTRSPVLRLPAPPTSLVVRAPQAHELSPRCGGRNGSPARANPTPNVVRGRPGILAGPFARRPPACSSCCPAVPRPFPPNTRCAVCRVVSMRPAQRPAASVLARKASTVRRLPIVTRVDRPSAPAAAATRTHRFSVSRIGGLAILDSTHKGRLQAALSGRSECVKASSRLVLVGQGVIDEILLDEVRGRKPRHLRRC